MSNKSRVTGMRLTMPDEHVIAISMKDIYEVSFDDVTMSSLLNYKFDVEDYVLNAHMLDSFTANRAELIISLSPTFEESLHSRDPVLSVTIDHEDESQSIYRVPSDPSEQTIQSVEDPHINNIFALTFEKA